MQAGLRGAFVVDANTKTLPRWEWRTFGQNLAPLEARIGLSLQTAPRESEEIYLLNFATPHSAKIRGGALEIKQLKEVDANGLERWSPSFKGVFPLSAELLRAGFLSLGARLPAAKREQYSLNEFLTEIIDREPSFRAVQLTKARRQFSYRGCLAELVRIQIGERMQESFCIENERPERIIAALCELGFDSHANVNFPRGVARMLGWAPT